MPRPSSVKKFFFFLALVIIILIVMKSTGFEQTTPLEGSLRDAFAPVQQLCTKVTRWVGDMLSFPMSVLDLSSRNRQLTEEVARLKGRLREAEEYRLENQRLKKLLDFQSTVVSQTYKEVVVAAVISRNPDNWFSTVTLNKGRRHGIKPNMPVLASEGLVGRVTSVGARTAEVLLITDPRSAVSSIVQQTRSPGLVEGVAGASTRLRMVHIPYDMFVREGQVVITSGMGSFFPKGIPVGEVIEVQRDPSGLFYNAMVRPFVDFNRLEEVLIIIDNK